MWIADPGVAQVVLARRKDFVQAPIASKIMNILGPNLITVSFCFCLRVCKAGTILLSRVPLVF
jgi:hypothetical protein